MKTIGYLLLILQLILTGCNKDVAKSPTQTGKENNMPTRLAETGHSSKIKIGYFEAPPHIFYDNPTKSLKGAAYDLFENYIAPELGVEFEWENEPTTIPRQLKKLEHTKRYIAILLIFVPDRLSYLVYSAKPYFYGQSVIVVRQTNPLVMINSVEDISHLVIGYAQNAYMTPFMQDPRITLDLIANPNYHGINLIKLSKNRIDGVYSPGKGAILVYIKEKNLIAETRIIDLPEKPSPYHVAFSKDLVKVAEQFDIIFASLGGETLYINLLKRYIDVTKL